MRRISSPNDDFVFAQHHADTGADPESIEYHMFRAALTVSTVASEPEPDSGYPAAVAMSALVRLTWKKARTEATESRFLSSGDGGSPSTSI